VGNTDSSNPSPAAEYFFTAAKSAGHSLIDVNNGEEAKIGGYAHVDVNIKTGQRWSVFKAFLEPILTRPNLRVSRYSQVTKVHLSGLIEIHSKYLQFHTNFRFI